jgi:hypothetical protein
VIEASANIVVEGENLSSVLPLNEAPGSSFYSLKEGSQEHHDLSCMGEETSLSPCIWYGRQYGLCTQGRTHEREIVSIFPIIDFGV